MDQEKLITLKEDIAYGFALWMKHNNYARNSIKNYHTQIKKLLGRKREISIPKIKAFLSIKSTLTKRSSIKLFIIFLEDMHNIRLESFRYPRLRKESKALIVISPQSVREIFNIISPEYKLFLKVMYFGGLRVSETANIKTDWFNWREWKQDNKDYGELKIIKAKRNKERIVPIHPALMEEIYRHIPKHQEGALMKGQLFNYDYENYMRKKKRKHIPEEVAEARYTDKVVRLFQINLAEASLKAIGKKLKTHSLRSSRATYLDEKGLRPSTIQYILGHENLSTTSRYIINTPEKVKKQLGKIEDIKF